MNSTCTAPPCRDAGPLLCKYNLHMLVCRLVPQALQRGHSTSNLEMWCACSAASPDMHVGLRIYTPCALLCPLSNTHPLDTCRMESLIQVVKQSTKYRTTSHPALIGAKSALEREHLLQLCFNYPEHTKSFDELIPAYRVADMRGRHLDVVDGDEDQLLGSGRAPTPEEVADIKAALRLRLADPRAPELGPGWTSFDCVPAQLQGTFVYQHAYRGGGDMFKSRLYQRATKTASFFALVEYEDEGGGNASTYIAEIYLFAKVAPVALACTAADGAIHGTATTAMYIDGGTGGGDDGHAQAVQPHVAPALGLAPVRIALCNLYTTTLQTSWFGEYYVVEELQQPARRVCLPVCEWGKRWSLACKMTAPMTTSPTRDMACLLCMATCRDKCRAPLSFEREM